MIIGGKRMNLVGDKIYLRNIEDEDINVLKTLINDENVSKDVVGWSKPISSMEHFTWFNNLKNDSNFRYMISSKENPKISYGTAIISRIDWKNRSSSIDVKLLEEFQGKGYGYETLILLTKYIFEELNMNRIFVNILEYNECSMSLFEKIGFVREGIQRKAIYKNGKYNNLIMYPMLKEEYQNERNR